MTDVELPLESPPQAALTVQELDALIAKLSDYRKLLDERKLETSRITADADRLEAKLMSALGEMGRSSYKAPFGTISVTNKWRVNLPTSDEEKMQLLEYFRTEGVYERMVTVNSNSLNSYYMQAWEAAKERGEGMDFKMPGVGDPKLNKILSFRKV